MEIPKEPAKNKVRKILFMAWDGASTHYMQGLFLPLLKGLRQQGFKVEVLHLCSANVQDLANASQQAGSYGIHYTAIPVRRRSVGGILRAVWSGRKKLKRWLADNPGNILMPRSLVPALLCLWVRAHRKAMLIYDADGLPLEERLDFAGWRKWQWRYRFFNRVERKILQKADRIMVRTTKAAEFLQKKHGLNRPEEPYPVINGRDEQLFKPLTTAQRDQFRLQEGFSADDIVAVYAGTLAPQYCLAEMLSWFELLVERLPHAKFLLLTRHIQPIRAMNLPGRVREGLRVKTVAPDQVPRYLGISDVGLSFRQATLSMSGVSPIKLGEYLMMGLPVIASKGIGDTEVLLSKTRYVCLINEQNPEELERSADWLAALVRGKKAPVPIRESVSLGRKHFSLSSAVISYLDAIE